jgi:hypothetical protein
MNDQDKPKVGHKRPPIEHRWKKGQCGNPKRIRKPKKKLSYIEYIDELLAKEIPMTEDGRTGRITVLGAIIRQLMERSKAGSKPATRTLLAYFDYAMQQQPGRSISIGLLEDPRVQLNRAEQE